MKLYTLTMAAFFAFGFHVCIGQGPNPVSWHFWAGNIEDHATTLYFKAMVAPGWHLYSQFLKDGGPMPTRFYFEGNDGLILDGATREQGPAVKFYDKTYEMEITWYSEEVIFQQDVKLDSRLQRINGRVEFMACNGDICVPAVKKFVVPINR